MVSTLNLAERDVLQAVLQVARDEFREEPDALRRLLSRIERLPATDETVDLAGAEADKGLGLMGPLAPRRTLSGTVKAD
jgi:hypothetical protein